MSRRVSITRKAPVTARAPVTENSNMLPHGARSAETPRATTEPRCRANASTVSETATPPSRREAPRIRLRRSVELRDVGRPRPPRHHPPRHLARVRRHGVGAGPTAPERELGGVGVPSRSRRRPSRSRAGRCSGPPAPHPSRVSPPVLPICSASAPTSSASTSGLSPSERARPATCTSVRPSGRAARTRTQTRRRRTNSDSISPARASTAAARAGPVPGLRATCSEAHRLTPSKVMLAAVRAGPWSRRGRVTAPAAGHRRHAPGSGRSLSSE